ncbi:MAG: nuclear transport factor 2 family protein [Betaproteobacteria bacterium]|nr:nuclear transport factor 2 family protein [Betaproteobacteria bacterium]
MSKSALSGFFFAVLVAFVPTSATADTADDIERLEQQRGQAILNADMPTLYAIYADDFFYNRARGDSLTRSEYLPMYALGELKVNKAVGEGRDIRVYGDTALVSGIVHVDATIKGENRNLHLRYLNVWVKRGSGWVLVARQATNLPAQN